MHPSFYQLERWIAERRLIRIWCLRKTVIRSKHKAELIPAKLGHTLVLNCEKQTSWMTLHEFHWALSISLGVIFQQVSFLDKPLWLMSFPVPNKLWAFTPRQLVLLKHLCLLPCLWNKSLNRRCFSKLGKSLFSCCNAASMRKKNLSVEPFFRPKYF